MRRAISSIAIVTLVLVAVILPGTAASAGDKPRIRHYKGQTSEGERFAVTVAVSDGVVRLTELDVGATLRCEDGTENGIGIGIGWSRGSQPVLTDQRLDVTVTEFITFALVLNGRLGSHRGSGTLTLLFPGLTADEQAQLCTTGELTWTLERTDRETSITGGQAVRVQRVEGRRITVAIGESEPGETASAARLEPRPVRHYRGLTSQDETMKVGTRRTEAGVDLLDFDWGYELACDDGTEFAGGSGYGFGGGLPMPPGRLDMDSVYVGPGGDALHVHGELGAHLGTGTVTLTMPALTDDLQAQLCVSGEQTWELWRTDAGY
jgi:hypothetical protein